MRFAAATLICGLAAFPATSRAADWRSEIGTFRIAIATPPGRGSAVPQLEPFRLAVQEALGVEAEIRADADLGRFIVNQSDRPSEYLVLPASAYAAIWLRCECIEPLVVAQSAAGDTAIRAVLITRKGSGVSTPADLANRRVFGLSRNSLAGFAMAQAAIASGGKDADWRFEPDGETALMKFAAGEGDAIAGWVPAGSRQGDGPAGTLARLRELGADMGAYSVIWTSGDIPNRVHAVRKSLDGEAKRLLREMMLSLESRDPVVYDALEPDFSGGYALARQAQFTALLDFLAAGRQQGDAGQTSSDDGTDGSAPPGQ